MFEILPGVTDWREIAVGLVPLLRAINAPCACEQGEHHWACRDNPLDRGFYNDDLVRTLTAA